MVEIRAAREGEEGAIVPLYEWLFAPPGSRPAAWGEGRAGGALRGAIRAPHSGRRAAWDERRAEVALREAIRSHDSVVLVADLDGELVGLCTAYQDLHSVRFGYRAWVEDLSR